MAGTLVCGLGELDRATLDRLLFGANGKRRHPSALQGQHSTVTDHRPGDLERLVSCHLSGGLLQRDCV
jgi:hypothetical protein